MFGMRMISGSVKVVAALLVAAALASNISWFMGIPVDPEGYRKLREELAADARSGRWYTREEIESRSKSRLEQQTTAQPKFGVAPLHYRPWLAFFTSFVALLLLRPAWGVTFISACVVALVLWALSVPSAAVWMMAAVIVHGVAMLWSRRRRTTHHA